MSSLLSIGLIVLMVCLYFSRSISKEALELLTDQEKYLLEKQFTGTGNRLHLVPIIVCFATYMLVSYLQPSFSSAAFVVFILFFLFFLFLNSIRALRKMKDTDLPAAYIREYRHSRWIYNMGFVLCGGILLYETVFSGG
ncbi:MAG: hypothetical protein NDI81_05495 [Desulfobacula sp.]|nr:hypothetical protein [Desulfobacula sp.]